MANEDEFHDFHAVLEAMKEPIDPNVAKLQPLWWVQLRKRFCKGEGNGKAERESC